MIIGGDFGNYEIKLMGDYGPDKFLSYLGEYRPLKADNKLGPNDMIYEYNGKKGFAADLADRESEFKRSRMGESKAHDDLIIRVLLGLHRYSNEFEHQLIVGQPYEKHEDSEKRLIKEMLRGRHEITVNGVRKVIVIRNVEVAIEGAASFWCEPIDGTVRIIDIGSGTINAISIKNKLYIDKECFGLNFGMNTNKSDDLENMIETIVTKASKWGKNDVVRIVGGVAERIEPYLKRYFNNASVFYPKVKISDRTTVLQPVFANAVGFYKIARSVFK